MTLVSKEPYKDSALIYLKRGIGSPIPLRARTKKPPLDGWTGYDAPYASGADVIEWSSNGRGVGNIALRLVETVIGIDVDAYGEKHGDEELARLEERLGKLPDTYVSTSRSAPSGIRYYRVPAGRAWADIAGPGIEIIHHGHRYAVVAPSIHPDTGSAYFWVWSSDWHRVAGPDLDLLPWLPKPWVEYLDRGPVSERSGKASVTNEHVQYLLESFPVGPLCPWIVRALDEGIAKLREGSRHDVARHWSAVLVRAGEQGHVGAVEALDVLRKEWLVALETGEKRHPDHGEWERMVEGAVAIVLKSPTPIEDRGCCGGAAGPDLSFEVSETGVSSFWDARPILAHVHQYARAQVVSPWAVLGVVMARMVTRIEHRVVLPDIIGSAGSLNLFVALVGDSGEGKGAAEGVATDAVRFGQHIDTVTVGSGEGICHFYAHREKQEVVRDKYACLFTVPEVDTLAALSGRTGATLLPELRKAWSGEQLGMLYADPAKRLPIERHTYRLCLVLGVQPLRAGGLLADAAGGTPQRFVWLPAGDPHLPDEAPEKPDPWMWPGIEDTTIWGHDGNRTMTVCQEARDVILEARRARMRGDLEALDGHALFCRLKVAAALALLDSRYDVTDEDWELAGTVMLVSSRTRDAVQARLAREITERNRARARSKGEEALIVAETVESAVVGRCRERVLKLLGDKDWTSHRDLRAGVSKEQRRHLEMVLTEMVAAGQIERKNEVDREWFKLGNQ